MVDNAIRLCYNYDIVTNGYIWTISACRNCAI